MKAILILVVLFLAKINATAQNTVKGYFDNIGTQEIGFEYDFSDNNNYVDFSYLDNPSYDMRVIEYSKMPNNEECLLFEYLGSKGKVTVVMCEDQSIAVQVPSGEVVEGYWYSVKENYR